MKKKVYNVTTHLRLGEKKIPSTKTTNKSSCTHVDPTKEDGKFKIKILDSFNLQNVDFIKIDAEGYELVAKGAVNTQNDVTIILYERKEHP